MRPLAHKVVSVVYHMSLMLLRNPFHQRRTVASEQRTSTFLVPPIEATEASKPESHLLPSQISKCSRCDGDDQDQDNTEYEEEPTSNSCSAEDSPLDEDDFSADDEEWDLESSPSTEANTKLNIVHKRYDEEKFSLNVDDSYPGAAEGKAEGQCPCHHCEITERELLRVPRSEIVDTEKTGARLNPNFVNVSADILGQKHDLYSAGSQARVLGKILPVEDHDNDNGNQDNVTDTTEEYDDRSDQTDSVDDFDIKEEDFYDENGELNASILKVVLYIFQEFFELMEPYEIINSVESMNLKLAKREDLTSQDLIDYYRDHKILIYMHAAHDLNKWISDKLDCKGRTYQQYLSKTLPKELNVKATTKAVGKYCGDLKKFNKTVNRLIRSTSTYPQKRTSESAEGHPPVSKLKVERINPNGIPVPGGIPCPLGHHCGTAAKTSTITTRNSPPTKCRIEIIGPDSQPIPGDIPCPPGYYLKKMETWSTTTKRDPPPHDCRIEVTGPDGEPIPGGIPCPDITSRAGGPSSSQWDLPNPHCRIEVIGSDGKPIPGGIPCPGSNSQDSNLDDDSTLDMSESDESNTDPVADPIGKNHLPLGGFVNLNQKRAVHRQDPESMAVALRRPYKVVCETVVYDGNVQQNCLGSANGVPITHQDTLQAGDYPPCDGQNDCQLQRVCWLFGSDAGDSRYCLDREENQTDEEWQASVAASTPPGFWDSLSPSGDGNARKRVADDQWEQISKEIDSITGISSNSQGYKSYNDFWAIDSQVGVIMKLMSHLNFSQCKDDKQCIIESLQQVANNNPGEARQAVLRSLQYFDNNFASIYGITRGPCQSRAETVYQCEPDDWPCVHWSTLELLECWNGGFLSKRSESETKAPTGNCEQRIKL